ncbi:MAG: ROK family protein [Nocardioides sp.]
MGGQEASALRRANTRVVVEQLREGGATSRAGLARDTGLAKQTVSTIVAALLTDGVVRELGSVRAESGGGRPAVLVAYAADRAFVAALELGVGRTRLVIADALGEPVQTQEVPHEPHAARPAAKVLADVVARLAQVMEGIGGLVLLRAVGVSVTGLVQPTSGRCVLAPNLGWRDVPVADLLRRALARRGCDVPVVVRGAAQSSLIAEHREGAATGQRDVVLLFEDEGVGAAIIEAGRLLDGADGTAGELGHCAWPGADARCGCGRRGCVETLASGPAVRRAVERATGRRVRRRDGEPTYAALARRDDPEVAEAAAEAGRVLGTAASWLTAVTAPRMVVLSGSLVLAPVALRTALVQVLCDRSLADAPPLVVAGVLGDGAAVRGAVLLALDEARRVRRL